MLRRTLAVVDQIEIRGRVALHDVVDVRVLCAKRTMVVLNVLINPLVVDDGLIGSAWKSVQTLNGLKVDSHHLSAMANRRELR